MRKRSYISPIQKILAFSILLFLMSCGPDTDPGPHWLGEYVLGEEGEAYIKFDSGSYWIYENNVTKERDTVVMQSYTSQMLWFEGERNKYSREDIKISWLVNSGQYEINLQHSYVDATPSPVPEAFVFHNTLLVGGTTGNFFYPFNTLWNGGTSGQTTRFIKLHDTIEVNNVPYSKVAEFETNKDWQTGGYTTNTFWAKNIGLIKREKYSPLTGEYIESKELIEYNVTQ